MWGMRRLTDTGEWVTEYLHMAVILVGWVVCRQDVHFVPFHGFMTGVSTMTSMRADHRAGNHRNEKMIIKSKSREQNSLNYVNKIHQIRWTHIKCNYKSKCHKVMFRKCAPCISTSILISVMLKFFSLVFYSDESSLIHKSGSESCAYPPTNGTNFPTLVN